MIEKKQSKTTMYSHEDFVIGLRVFQLKKLTANKCIAPQAMKRSSSIMSYHTRIKDILKWMSIAL